MPENLRMKYAPCLVCTEWYENKCRFLAQLALLLNITKSGKTRLRMITHWDY